MNKLFLRLLFKYEMFKSSGGFSSWLAYKLPNSVVYYAFIRVAGYATTQPPYDTKHPDTISIFEVMKVWREKND